MEIDPHISEIINIKGWVDHLLRDVEQTTKDIPEEAELLSGWGAASLHVGGQEWLATGTPQAQTQLQLTSLPDSARPRHWRTHKTVIATKLAGSSRPHGATNRSSQDTEHHVSPKWSQQEQRHAMTQPRCPSPSVWQHRQRTSKSCSGSLHCELCCCPPTRGGITPSLTASLLRVRWAVPFQPSAQNSLRGQTESWTKFLVIEMMTVEALVTSMCVGIGATFPTSGKRPKS